MAGNGPGEVGRARYTLSALVIFLLLVGVTTINRQRRAASLEKGRLIDELQKMQAEVAAITSELSSLLPVRNASVGRNLLQLSDQPTNQPSPPSFEELKRRVKQTPECLEAVKQSVNTNSFSSQYAQDWFIVMNYFHHLPKGFYLDVGANQPRELSNTWFLDVCLGWDGICVEASPVLAADLRKKRSCTVVNHCVDSQRRTVALQAAGTEIGNVVPVEKKNAKAQVIECTTFKDIIRDHNIKHIDFMSLDVENYEPNVLATFVEEDEGLEIDLILIENEKTSKVPNTCHHSNLLRFPFWNRGYALVDFFGGPQGDDLWVKLGRPHLWRNQLVYARGNKLRERTRAAAYRLKPKQYTEEIRDKLLSIDV
eukprot:TRINITY_DN6024_c0_g1_i1.p2 TRINITY_DN6024_c0_g1~~TRINITY_DN6024_c0_g1_i1.p2  ORF type:complete len:376 (+),score=68.84 TRINITY_DN6024_c0_g1_i1:25-1128(+)